MNKKQLPTGVRVLLGFVSVILCIVLFVCSLVTILIADLGLLTSKGGLQKLIQDILFSTSAPARPGFAPAGALPGRNPIRMDEPDFGGSSCDCPAFEWQRGLRHGTSHGANAPGGDGSDSNGVAGYGTSRDRTSGDGTSCDRTSGHRAARDGTGRTGNLRGGYGI